MLEKDWMKKGRKERSAYLSRLNENEKYEALNDITIAIRSFLDEYIEYPGYSTTKIFILR